MLRELRKFVGEMFSWAPRKDYEMWTTAVGRWGRKENNKDGMTRNGNHLPGGKEADVWKAPIRGMNENGGTYRGKERIRRATNEWDRIGGSEREGLKKFHERTASSGKINAFYWLKLFENICICQVKDQLQPFNIHMYGEYFSKQPFWILLSMVLVFTKPRSTPNTTTTTITTSQDVVVTSSGSLIAVKPFQDASTGRWLIR